MLDLRQSNEPVYYGADQLQEPNTNQLRDVEQRHGEMRHLENNIVQLHEIHRDFAELVSGHGEITDNIEMNVTQTEHQVETGIKSLAKAVNLQSAVRRKKIICGVVTFIILVLIAIIVTAVLLSQKPK